MNLDTFLYLIDKKAIPFNNNYVSYNTIIKKYNNHTFKIQKNSWYVLSNLPPTPHNGTYSLQKKEDKTIQYLKQTKKTIFDFAYNNQDKFQYFVTLTFNIPDSKYSHDLVLSKLRNWLITQRRSNPNMYYILVPEFHPTSTINRLHFHGLFGNCPSWKFKPAINSNTGKPIFTKNGSQIYNLVNYSLGFTTVSFIDRPEEVSNYISKYTTKEIINLSSLKHKKKFWHSSNLDRVEVRKLDFTGNVYDLGYKFGCIYYNEYKRDNSSVELGSFYC